MPLPSWTVTCLLFKYFGRSFQCRSLASANPAIHRIAMSKTNRRVIETPVRLGPAESQCSPDEVDDRTSPKLRRREARRSRPPPSLVRRPETEETPACPDQRPPVERKSRHTH